MSVTPSVANLAEGQIEVYTDPSGPTAQSDYHQRRDFRAGDEVPVSLEGREVGRIAADAVLPSS